MQTFQTVRGAVLRLDQLTAEQRAFFDRCYAAYRADMPWNDFSLLIAGPENPLVRDADGWVTRGVYDHVLFQAVRDLESRLGLRQGQLAPEPDWDPDRDPLADEWLPVVAAARRKGVTAAAVRQAISRGRLIARPAKPGATGRLVSAASLSEWHPNRRQAAGRHIATAVS